MLESIRKYQWLMIAVFVLLAAGFLFTFNDFGSTRNPNRRTLLTVDGRGYDQQSIGRLGESSIRLAQQLNFVEMVGLLGEHPYQPNIQKFVVNRLVVQDYAKDFGLYPSDEQAEKTIKEEIFVKDGEFDAQAYTNITSRFLPNLSLSERDLLQLVKDKIALDLLVNLVGSNLAPPTEFARSTYQEMSQQLTLQRFEFVIDEFKTDLEPSEEEVKEFWAENTLNYMALPQYRVRYVLSSPNYPESSEEDGAARAEAEQINSEKVDQFWENVNQADGADFAKLAEDAGLEVVESEWFTRENAPSDLTLPLIGVDGTLLSAVQQIRPTAEGMDRVSNPLPVSDKRWIVFELIEAKEAEPLPFETAKENARTDLVAKLAKEAAEAAAEELQQKLDEAITSGKSFEEATADFDKKPTKLGPFKVSERLPSEMNSRRLFDEAKRLPVETTTGIIDDGSRVLFCYVEAREIFKSEDEAQTVEQIVDQGASFNRYRTFTNWLSQKTEEAGVDSQLQL